MSVALVTVRARRIRIFPAAVTIEHAGDTPIALVLPELDWPRPDPIAADDPPPTGELAPVAAPVLIDFPGVGVMAEPVVPASPRPRHTPLPKISLKDVPSGMEQLAERWRGAP